MKAEAENIYNKIFDEVLEKEGATDQQAIQVIEDALKQAQLDMIEKCITIVNGKHLIGSVEPYPLDHFDWNEEIDNMVDAIRKLKEGV